MKKIGILFLSVALLSLMLALSAGIIVGTQFLHPTFFNQVPFHHLRPLHVSLAIWWIFLAASGGVYFYLQTLAERTDFELNAEWIFSSKASKLAIAHLCLFLFAGCSIIYCYLNGIFGGKEYLNYPPILSLPIFLGWLCFVVNIFKTTGFLNNRWPVFLWMWISGGLLFLYSFFEAHLWMAPFFGNNIVRDLTVQWKSYGALVASWNQLIYGTAMCIMYLISQDRQVAYGKLPFFLFFLGFTNSLFNWGHHTYTVPTMGIIREVSYLISMTELFILARIIWTWRKSLSENQKFKHIMSCRFLMATDVWVLLNLGLAIAISIPALNVFTHGTHIVIAHSMGATLGINSMILLASISYILTYRLNCEQKQCRRFNFAFWLTNISLLFFWCALVSAGVVKGYYLHTSPEIVHSQLMQNLRPYLSLFLTAGCGVAIGLFLLAIPMFFTLIKQFANEPSSAKQPDFSGKLAQRTLSH